MDEERPHLTAEQREAIAVAQYYSEKSHHEKLLAFVKDLPSTFVTKVGILGVDDGKPAPPKQPIAVSKELGEYARELFATELCYYPERNDLLPKWRADLSKSVEDRVMKHALRVAHAADGMAAIFGKSLGLTYHLSADEMRKAVQSALEPLAPSAPHSLVAKMLPKKSEPPTPLLRGLLPPVHTSTSAQDDELKPPAQASRAQSISERLDEVARTLDISHEELASRISISRTTYFEVKAGRGGRRSRRSVDNYLTDFFSKKKRPNPD